MMPARNWIGLLLTAGLLWGLFGGAMRINVAAPAMAPAERVLILDPGHGGEDGGAVSVTGTKESVINLAIALRCRDLATFLGKEPVLTRTSEELTYPETAQTLRAKKVADQKGRVALVNACPSAYFVSIHQNKYTSPLPSGAQTFYANGAENEAEALQELFLKYINRDRKRTAKPVDASIYLMKHISCPALLVECGFLSNPEEAAKLEEAGYQKKLALLIIGTLVPHIG
ncbi:MAG: N-acetylmuramoyl-L-alanine amidase [bacterium]